MIEFQNPIGDIREEIAVVGDDDKRALELLQIFFKPVGSFGIEVVCGLVKEQDVGIGEQQAANRDAAALAAGEDRDRLGAIGASHIGHLALDEVFEVPVIVAVDDFLELFHFSRGLRIVEFATEVFIALHHRLRLGDAFHHSLKHGFGVVELRFLGQIADLRALGDLDGADEVGVESGENFQKRRLAGAIRADYADMRPVEEAEIDVLQNGLGSRLFGNVDQTELIFSCHVDAYSLINTVM